MRVFVAPLAGLSWLLCAWLLVFSFSNTVCAQDARPTAQQLFERGVELTKAEQWAEAQTSFEASLAIEARSATYLNLAIVRYRLGEYVKALTALEAFERDAGLNEDMKKRAEWLREKLASHVVHFDLRVEPAEAVLEIDGTPQPGSGNNRPLWLTPGQHDIRATAEGRQAQSLRIVATAGQKTEASIELPIAVTSIPVTLPDDGARPLPPVQSAPSEKRALWKNPWLWTAVGVVVVGGAVTAGVLLSRDKSNGNACDPKVDLCL